MLSGCYPRQLWVAAALNVTESHSQSLLREARCRTIHPVWCLVPTRSKQPAHSLKPPDPSTVAENLKIAENTFTRPCVFRSQHALLKENRWPPEPRLAAPNPSCQASRSPFKSCSRTGSQDLGIPWTDIANQTAEQKSIHPPPWYCRPGTEQPWSSKQHFLCSLRARKLPASWLWRWWR